MKTVKTIIAAGMLALAAACSNSNNTEENKSANDNLIEQTVSVPAGKPEDVAVDFLNAYSKYFTNNSSNISIDKWVEQSGMVTDDYLAKFKTVLATVDGDMGLEADPIMEAQNTPPAPFKVKSYDEKTGRVICSAGEGWDKPVMVKNIGGKWLVDGSGMVNMPKN